MENLLKRLKNSRGMLEVFFHEGCICCGGSLIGALIFLYAFLA